VHGKEGRGGSEKPGLDAPRLVASDEPSGDVGDRVGDERPRQH
jgi:hypothetical protein